MAFLALSLGAPAMARQAGDCPDNPDWSENTVMELTPVERDGQEILLAEGRVDIDLPQRLHSVLEANPDIAEIWLRSPGGDAMAGNDAGYLIRRYPGVTTRIPNGWTCAGACNFVFMGARNRVVEPEGVFMVRMFTISGDDQVIANVEGGGAAAEQEIAAIDGSSRLQATADVDFVVRMGISRRLLDIMYATSAVDGETRCLTREELLDLGVIFAAE